MGSNGPALAGRIRSLFKARTGRNRGTRRREKRGGEPGDRDWRTEASVGHGQQFGADQVIDLEEAKNSRSAHPNCARVDAMAMERTQFWKCVGAPAAVVEGMEMCRDGGKFTLCSVIIAMPEQWPSIPHVITRKQLQVFGPGRASRGI